MIVLTLYWLGVTAAGVLIFLMALVAIMRVRTMRSPALFQIRLRLLDSTKPGMQAKWTRGYGGWVSTVLTLRKGLMIGIAEVYPIATLDKVRLVAPKELKGLGEEPRVATFTLANGPKIEIAFAAKTQYKVLKPWAAQLEQIATKRPDKPVTTPAPRTIDTNTSASIPKSAP